VKAILVLQDGRVFKGRAFGASGEIAAEVVFNTGMAGYQELLTDPSYNGQIVNMTYPLIGNYGINDDDYESKKIQVSGFIVRELCQWPSNYRSLRTLDEWFKKNNIIGIEGIDTRALTKHIREAGSMNGVISTEHDDVQQLIKKAQAAPNMAGQDLVKNVTCPAAYQYSHSAEAEFNVTVIDCGVKTNILRELTKRGCNVKVEPAHATSEAILAAKPDGIMISNGPGDPAAVTYLIETLKTVIKQVPTFGICLGHQMLGHALGGTTSKMKFGHRGVNHPVREEASGCVAITSQNHGFCVEAHSLPDDVDVTHINMNDRTVEGLRHKTLPIFSVQHHPEACPGPHDAASLFDRFVDMMKNNK
jgi:carbamoyl-phosphate synthase small subunit